MSAAPTLYSLTEDLCVLEESLDSLEFTDEEKNRILDEWLASCGLDEKLDRYCGLIRECEARAEIRKNEAKRLRELSDTDTNLVKSLKSRLQWFLGLRGVEKWNTTHFKLSVCNNGGKVPLLVSVDPELLPEKYQKRTIEADNEAIRADLELGLDVPGCMLGERGQNLRIT